MPACTAAPTYMPPRPSYVFQTPAVRIHTRPVACMRRIDPFRKVLVPSLKPRVASARLLGHLETDPFIPVLHARPNAKLVDVAAFNDVTRLTADNDTNRLTSM